MTWVQSAKKREQTIGSILSDTGTLAPRTQVIPQVGYLDRLNMSEALQFQFNTAAATSADAFAAVGGNLRRITLFVNSIGNLFDCSGFMAGIIDAIDNNYNYGNGAKVQATPAVFASAAGAGVASTTNKWFFHIPLGLYLTNAPWPIGLFQTALQNLSIRLNVLWQPLRGVAGTPGSGMYVPAGGTLVTTDQNGQLQINETYFDPIADQASQPYLGFIHRWQEFQVPLTSGGDTQILLPGQNYYTRIILAIVSGGSGALALDGTNLQRLRLMYGANLAPFDEDETKGEVSARMRRQYGLTFETFPVGVYTLDFIHQTHDNRDWINAAGTTNLRVVVTMANSGTYTGGGYILVATEEVAPLALPAAAQVQGGTAGVALG